MTDSRYFEQGTPEWYEARLHRFTSSEVHKLIPGARARPGELTKTAVAYVFDKIADRITAGGCLEYRELNTREIEWGREHEDTGTAGLFDDYERRCPDLRILRLRGFALFRRKS